jgi:hypothetical protein
MVVGSKPRAALAPRDKFLRYLALATVVSLCIWILSSYEIGSFQQLATSNIGLDAGPSKAQRYFELDPPSCKATVRDANIFDTIYKESRWAGDGLQLESMTPAYYYPHGKTDENNNRRSMSGTGSSRGYATNQSLTFLVDVIKELKITSMLDIPCGDLNWQMDAWETDSLNIYVGADVVPAVIALNKRRFSHHVNKQFVLWDFVTCPLPKLAVWKAEASEPTGQVFDVVHVRDVLQHLPLNDGARAAKHLLTSGIPYIIATTFPNGTNEEIQQGEYFMSNREKAPYNFPKPIRCVATHPNIEPDLTCLYKS